jgi:hypothetical protein
MRTLARAALLAALLVTPLAALAEDAAPAKPAAAMPCTGPNDKGCCGGACMDMQAKAAAGEAKPAEVDCPCKRAAKEAAAAKAAEAAKQAPQ